METSVDLPERRSDTGSDAEDTHQAALLIDFDNVTLGIRSNLGAELRNLLSSEVIRGNVAVQRAYADWRRYPQYIVPLAEASIDLIFAPAYGSSKKNATDIRLAIDALELVFTRPEIKTFILMSGDSDFSSLVLKLKEYGRYVIGVGIQESSSDLLVQNCDEYYSYTALSGLSKAGEETIERHDPWELTEKAVRKMVERGDTMRSDRLKQVMLEIDPSFNEKEQGFNKFNRFIVEAASRGLLAIQRMENGQYSVGPGDQVAGDGDRAAAKKEERAEPRRAGGRRGRAKSQGARQEATAQKSEGAGRERAKLTMESALKLLDQALELLTAGEDGPARDSDVKRHMLKLDAAFDEGELGYSKFSKFLLAAEEAGAIELARGPTGNYQVRGVAGPAPKRGAPQARQRREPQPRKRRDSRPPRRTPAEKAAPKESTMKKLTRFLFGGETSQTEVAPRAPKPSAPSPQRPRPKRSPSREAAPAAAGRSEGAARSSKREDPPRSDSRSRRASRVEGPEVPQRKARKGARSTKAETPVTGRGGPRSDSSRTRGGRPETDRRKPEKSTDTPVTGVDEVVKERATEETKKLVSTVSESSAVTKAPLPGAPRGTIRGRWGKKGRYRPAAAPPPLFEGQTVGREPAASVPSRGSTLPSDPKAIVAHLKTSYAGVGEKTAELLVESFGSDLFRILDDEPERVRQLLPDRRRAERVLAARQAELRSGDK